MHSFRGICKCSRPKRPQSNLHSTVEAPSQVRPRKSHRNPCELQEPSSSQLLLVAAQLPNIRFVCTSCRSLPLAYRSWMPDDARPDCHHFDRKLARSKRHSKCRQRARPGSPAFEESLLQVVLQKGRACSKNSRDVTWRFHRKAHRKATRLWLCGLEMTRALSPSAPSHA